MSYDNQFAPVFRCNATLGSDMNTAPKTISEDLAEVKMQIGQISKQLNDQENMMKTFMTTLAENNSLMQQAMKQLQKKAKFPITSLAQLAAIEKDVANSHNEYVSLIRTIIQPLGLIKGLRKLITDVTLHHLNYDGVQAKLAFKNYEAINNAIFEAIQTEGYTKGEYVADIKKAMKQAKNRQNKTNSLKKKITK